jgi:hypothetical protein
MEDSCHYAFSSRSSKFGALCVVASPFFDHLIDGEISYEHFMPVNATSRTANKTVGALNEVFGERV